MVKFNICKCYYTENYFVRAVQAHLRYETDEQVKFDYANLAHECGVSMEAVLAEVKEEKQRRLDTVEDAAERRLRIQRNHTPLHKDLFKMQERFFDDRFRVLYRGVSDGNKDILKDYRVGQEKYGLYQFPIFSDEFCRWLIEEVEHFQQTDLPQIRPNTMNYYGLILDEIGFSNFFDVLRSKYLSPFANAAFPEWTGAGLDSHRAFTVSYKSDPKQNLKQQQVDLALHYDNAEVTLNVSLNDGFEGGEIYFRGVRTGSDSVTLAQDKEIFMEHKRGWGILHRGRQLHGALRVEDESRHNLILWMRASSVRNTLCPMCWQKPTLIPVSENCYGDGFTS